MRLLKRFDRPTVDRLEQAYLVEPYPSDDAKRQLAKECGISYKQVVNWFVNKRMRSK